uniref:Secreted protein n=1 Tax=Anopheles funestus TaxID=62324 RepID=A0A182R4Y8_ANOFN
MQFKPSHSMLLLLLVVLVNVFAQVTAGIPRRVRRAHELQTNQARELPPTFSIVQPEVFFVSYGSGAQNTNSEVKIIPQTFRHQQVS